MRAIVLSGVAALAAAQSTCNPSTWKQGYDYKQQFYEHTNATSPADCCSKCSTWSTATLKKCLFWTFDGVDTCWLKPSNKGGRKSSPKVTCGSVNNVPFPTPPPTPPPTPAPPTPPPTPPPATPPPTPWDNKPVKVFVMMGQSNMLGEGRVVGLGDKNNNTLQHAVEVDGMYPYLWDKQTNQWAVSDQVRNVFVMTNGNATFNESKMQDNEWMQVPVKCEGCNKDSIGPELGIGFTLGKDTSLGHIMTLKSCIGNRALGWDLLPPGSKGYTYNNYTYAGYGESPAKWKAGDPHTSGSVSAWYAGKQWDGDTRNAQHILDNLPTYYPGAQKYEVAGFFWWQGDKDSRDMGMASHYEENLVNLIKTLRKTFNTKDDAPFVTASLGQSVKGSTSGDGLILDAMLNVDGTSGKYPEFKGNVAAVYTHPLLNTPGSSGAHYGKDAKTYMNVGQAMGEAMVKLLEGQQ